MELKSLKNLILSCNSFNGSFPTPELSGFENLETLDLSWNSLSDSPRELDAANFSKLRNVVLHNNYFNSTEILRLLGSLPSLRSLDLSSNMLGMESTLSNQDLITLGRLELLDLRRNYFNGSIPQNLGKLSSLKALYLAGNLFKGSLPVPGLCELRRLQVLDISHNRLEGTLPSCLSNLTSLKVLDVHDNLLSGSITPNLIPSQKFLQFIDISNNVFEGSFSFSSMFNLSKLEVIVLGGTKNKLQIDNDNQAGNGIPLFQLKVLQLSNCSMKSAPLFLLSQHRLIWVDISHNKLSGAIPSWLLQNNTDLKFLNLRNNSFTGKLDPFPQHPLSSMVHMDASYNHIDGHLPKDLGIVLPNLQYLNLSYNFFKGELPSSVGAMRKLLLLDLSFNNLSGKLPNELVKICTDLGVLKLNNNNFRGDFFSTDFNLSDLRALELGNNEFTGGLMTKEEFYAEMRIFDVSNNKMTGKIPNGIDAKVLLLQKNSFEGQIPCEGFFNAQVVDISHNFLSGQIPSCLISKAFSNVKLLNLRDNRLSGNIPAEISFFPSLRILLLGNNRFNGLIPRQLCQLRDISIMDLSNFFSWSIPSCLSNVSFGNYFSYSWGNLMFSYWNIRHEDGYSDLYPLVRLYDFTSFWDNVKLEDQYVFNIDFVTKNNLLSFKGNILDYMSGLDLSCNNLTGAIPRSLGKLFSIRALNLSHNHLTGHIPVSLSNLSQIESLDFSYNNLSGRIPSELVDLNFFAVFSVAHNNLSGRIPDKGQFATFGINSYKGNPFLNGLPSEKNRTKPIEIPLSSDETEEKWYDIDRTFFISSFVATYGVFLLTFGALFYINPYWRRRWFRFIENFIYSS
ncbi:receptor-like protein 15 isoform X2 [Gossypium raimondii]|nr:receptor-like protein 15 isoform X2 [Gossypium raimondii]